MAELVDAHDSKSCGVIHESSILSPGTMNKPTVLIILGPTASGKSDLAVKIAKKYKGEIISADSRQVYKGLEVGSGKITKEEMGGILHYLFDVASPKKRFSADDYRKLANQALENIVKKDKLPIIVGGTGFYIDSLTGTTTLPEVPPNKILRKRLEKKSAEELYKILKKKDSIRAKSIDKHNKVRLIRALEIIKALGKVPPLRQGDAEQAAYKFVYIGIKPSDLEEKILKRLLRRLPGIVREVKKLHGEGVSWKRMFELGLEYRYVSLYVQGKLSKVEMVEKLYREIKHYSKRQMTWFKRNKKIKWFETNSKEISSFLSATLR
jgi:tRNA dimethylallyltransferase